MKHCDKKRGQCCWQNIENPSLCAYKNDMEEWMICPEMLDNWEEIIDKLCTPIGYILTKEEVKEIINE